jgi:hypothetical protein
MSRLQNRVVCRVRAAGSSVGKLPALAVLTLSTLLPAKASLASSDTPPPTVARAESARTPTAAEPRSDSTAGRFAEKADVILELIPFVDWPATPATSPPHEFVIGVLGDERLAGAIRAAAQGRTGKERPLRILSFHNLDEVDPCPILVIGSDKARLLPVILDFLRDSQGILTVGDRADFAAQGGIVELVELPGRIGFTINRDAAGRAGLHLGSQLLRLAEGLLPAESSEIPGG